MALQKKSNLKICSAYYNSAQIRYSHAVLDGDFVILLLGENIISLIPIIKINSLNKIEFKGTNEERKAIWKDKIQSENENKKILNLLVLQNC